MISSTASSKSSTIAAPMNSVPTTSPDTSGPGPPAPIPPSTATAPGVSSSSNTSPTPSHRSHPQPQPQPQPRSTPTPPPPPPPPGSSREPQQPTAPTLPPPTVSSSPAAATAHQQQSQPSPSHYAPHARQLSNPPRPHHPHLPLPGPPAPFMPAAHALTESAGAKRTASVAELPKTNTTVGSALASGIAQAPKRQALQTSTGPGPQPVAASVATNTRRLSLTSGLGTPISAHPHTPVSGVTMSFPPAPVEQQRQQQQQQQQQQQSAYQSYQHPSLPPPPALHSVTDSELQGRSPDQLISTILSMQSQHQQYVAHISAQYETINQQLNELRGSLQAFHNSQAASHQAAAATISPREPVSSTSSGRHAGSMGHYQSHHKRPSTSSSSRNGHARPFIPTSPTSSAHVLPRPNSQQAGVTGTPQHPHHHHQPQQQQHSPGPPAYDYRTVGTVDEVWKEYKEGMDGQPAVEELDATWGSRWRPEPRGRTWYSRRKVIWDKIKEYIAEGMDENSAVQEVEKLRDGGTVNKLIRSLQDERKEKGGGEDSFH